jgi:predicted transglutaminase-like cysteine proteinase
MGFFSFFKSMPLDERHARLLVKYANATTENKIRAVNTFFNRYVRYTTDQKQHKKEDYWQSLEETLASKKGDCDDFALAKFFTLRMLDIPEENLRLGWCQIKAITEGNSNHLVLLYVVEGSQTKVLDNITNAVKGKNQRRDLKFLFEVNSYGRWLEDGRRVADESPDFVTAYRKHINKK